MNNIEIINSIIESYIGKKRDPYSTTIGSINNQECGNHRGLYYIYPEVNFYFGISSKKNATIISRHEKHKAKLDVNFKKLYGPDNKKKEPQIQFPKGWQEGICKYIIEGIEEIPQYFKKTSDGYVEPINVDFSLKHLLDINKIEVVIWNLKEYSSHTIEAIEEEVIETIFPFCNTETSKLRNKLSKMFLETVKIIKKNHDYDELLNECFTLFEDKILNNEGPPISTKNIHRLNFSRQYFIDEQDKYNHLLRDIFIDWCQIVESNNEII